MSSRYELVIFDFDGTLADSLTWFRTAMDEVAARHDLPAMCDERAEALRGLTPKQIMSELQIPAWKVPFIAADVRARAAENVDKITLYEGIPEALRALHDAGIQLAVVSSNGETAVREVLGPELTPLFSQFACGAALFGKSSVFKKVIRRAGASAATTLSVGDEVRDIDAARETGCDCAAVSWGFATRTILSEQNPTALLDDTSALPPCVLSTAPNGAAQPA